MSTLEELVLLGKIIWVLVITLLVLSYVTVGLRLWVRYRITKSPGWDDVSMIATLVRPFQMIRPTRIRTQLVIFELN